MTDLEKVNALRTELLRQRALIADLKQWSMDAGRIADMQEALDEIDKTLEETG